MLHRTWHTLGCWSWRRQEWFVASSLGFGRSGSIRAAPAAEDVGKCFVTASWIRGSGKENARNLGFFARSTALDEQALVQIEGDFGQPFRYDAEKQDEIRSQRSLGRRSVPPRIHGGGQHPRLAFFQPQQTQADELGHRLTTAR